VSGSSRSPNSVLVTSRCFALLKTCEPLGVCEPFGDTDDKQDATQHSDQITDPPKHVLEHQFFSFLTGLLRWRDQAEGRI
jgi:hypothetical protein